MSDTMRGAVLQSAGTLDARNIGHLIQYVDPSVTTGWTDPKLIIAVHHTGTLTAVDLPDGVRTIGDSGEIVRLTADAEGGADRG